MPLEVRGNAVLSDVGTATDVPLAGAWKCIEYGRACAGVWKIVTDMPLAGAWKCNLVYSLVFFMH